MAQKTGSALMWVIISVLVVLGFFYFSGSGSPDEVEYEAKLTFEIPDGPIVLGAMAPLSGEAVVYGDPLQKTTNLAIAEINAAGGVDGHELQVIWEDSKCDPQNGTEAAQKLVEVDKVKFIIGTVCSGSTLAAAEITEPAGVLLVSAAATSPYISSAGDFVFRTYPSDGIGGAVLSSYVSKELGKMKLAMISEQTDYAQGLRKTFGDTFTSLGGEIVADENYISGDTDFRTQILKVKASGADVVYVNPQTPISGVLVLKQMFESGLDIQIVVNDTMISEDTISANTTLYKDVYTAAPELDKSRAMTKQYLDNYQAEYGEAPSYEAYQASAYDQVYLLAEAFGKVGTDPAAVRDWLYQVKDWPGALGDITIDKNGDPIIGYNIKHVVDADLQDLGSYSL